MVLSRQNLQNIENTAELTLHGMEKVSVEIVVGNLKMAILRFADLMEIMVGILCFLEKEKELMVQ